jgi:hypothetical protein
MKTSELFEDDPGLTGYLDVQALAKLLPEVTAPDLFLSALTKIRIGKDSELTLQEKLQMALGFMSLIAMDATQKSMVMHQIMSVKTDPEQVAQAKQPQQKPTQPA